MFKFIGAFLGYKFLSIPGVFLGFMIGGAIDRALSLGVGAVNPLSSKKRQEVFLKTVFLLMGKLAKADNHISQDEIDHAQKFMTQLGMTDEHRQQAIEYFKQGSQDEFEIESALREFLSTCGQTRNLTQALLSYVITMALADGVMHPKEQQLLERMAQILGFSQQEFDQLMAMIGKQSGFSGQPSAASSINDAYVALGVSENDSDQTIKRAYRKLISKCHPDKLMGQGMPEDMIKGATEQSQKIQAAYELIKKSRG